MFDIDLLSDWIHFCYAYPLYWWSADKSLNTKCMGLLLLDIFWIWNTSIFRSIRVHGSMANMLISAFAAAAIYWLAGDIPGRPALRHLAIEAPAGKEIPQKITHLSFTNKIFARKNMDIRLRIQFTRRSWSEGMENGNAAQESPKGGWNCKADQRLFIALQRILLDCITLLSGYSKFWCSILKTLHSIYYTCTRERVKFQCRKRFLAKTHFLNTFVNFALFLLHLFFLYWKLVKSSKLVSKLCV